MRRDVSRWRAGGRLVLSAVVLFGSLFGCRSDEKRRLDSGDLAGPVQDRDSVWAVELAAREYARHSPGTPMQVEGFRREDGDFIITFDPGREWVGGRGVIRVKPDGSTRVEELDQ